MSNVVEDRLPRAGDFPSPDHHVGGRNRFVRQRAALEGLALLRFRYRICLLGIAARAGATLPALRSVSGFGVAPSPASPRPTGRRVFEGVKLTLPVCTTVSNASIAVEETPGRWHRRFRASSRRPDPSRSISRNNPFRRRCLAEGTFRPPGPARTVPQLSTAAAPSPVRTVAAHASVPTAVSMPKPIRLPSRRASQRGRPGLSP